MSLNNRIELGLRHAVKQFWDTRKKQARQQGGRTRLKDAGARAAVTGGAQMDGLVTLVRDLLHESGTPDAEIFRNTRVELPGWYRPEKKWDLLVVKDGRLLAGIEFKSQVGSFGNNYNNRTEEAIGSATDLWAAYREGAFKPSARPWLGYLMLLEEAPASTAPVASREPHFKVFPEFIGASYTNRYEILLTKLVRERLYDAGCFLLSDEAGGLKGAYREPSIELCFQNFISSLLGHLLGTRKVTD
jgi:hypothetical protein